MSINDILNNNENIYYGHGTGVHGNLFVDSIMINGLRCSHNSLYYTSIPLGIGGSIPNETEELLKSWPHFDSKIIVLVSLPYKYRVIDTVGLGTYMKGEAAFYYIPSEEQQKDYNLTNSFYVMPEFVKGYYDVRNNTFTNNSKYYENLSEQEQKALFEKVKENYFNILEDGYGAEKYKELIESNKEWGYIFPLNNEEIDKFKKKRSERELLSKIDEEVLKKTISLSNGSKITFSDYLNSYVFPVLPIREKVTLLNGNAIPYTHFIMECVLYDCLERYNGDFNSYLNSNVDVEKTIGLIGNSSLKK